MSTEREIGILIQEKELQAEKETDPVKLDMLLREIGTLKIMRGELYG